MRINTRNGWPYPVVIHMVASHLVVRLGDAASPQSPVNHAKNESTVHRFISHQSTRRSVTCECAGDTGAARPPTGVWRVLWSDVSLTVDRYSDAVDTVVRRATLLGGQEGHGVQIPLW